MPTNTKKQHYIPQFLLKKFAIVRKKRAEVFVLDKQSGQKFRASVQDIAHENYFYKATSTDGHKVALEDFMAMEDGKGAAIINEIFSNESYLYTETFEYEYIQFDVFTTLQCLDLKPITHLIEKTN